MAVEPRTLHSTEISVIEPPSRWPGLGLAELWRYRELLVTMAWRNVLVRYKQTALGMAWAVIQPVFLMIFFTLFFGRLAGLESKSEIPYPILTYSALLPWVFFTSALTQAAGSLVGNANLLRKIYFPRVALPLAAVMTAAVDFVVAFWVLIGLMVWYHRYPEPLRLFALPPLLGLAFILALGVGMLLSALNVYFRDIQFLVPFLMQIWLFATPVAYPSTLVKSDLLHTLFGLNPMAGVIDGFRWALVKGPPPGNELILSTIVSFAVLAVGIVVFRRLERSFADAV